MPQEGMPPKSFRERQSEALNVLGFLARIVAMIAEPFVNSAPGSGRFGVFALFAFGGMLFIAGNYHDVVAYQFVWVWVVMIAFRRIQVLIRWRRGGKCHSLDEGSPWIINLFHLRWLGMMANPLLCGLIGWALTNVSEVLGQMWMASGVAMAFLGMTNSVIYAARARAMDDARIEMEWSAQQGRN